MKVISRERLSRFSSNLELQCPNLRESVQKIAKMFVSVQEVSSYKCEIKSVFYIPVKCTLFGLRILVLIVDLKVLNDENRAVTPDVTAVT